jgi:adenosylcobinamide-GDP ribazoletransferase
MRASQRFLYAVSLLTVIPVRLKTSPEPGDSGRAAIWFPWIGLLIGSCVAFVKLGLGAVLPPLVGASVCVAAWAILTGGLHLDGLADCCDGLLHPSNPQRRLEIMRDPHLGSFGVTGLIMILLIKTTALATLPSTPAGLLSILLAAVLGRWLVLLAGLQPLARPGGMGADMALGLNRRTVLVSAILPTALATMIGLAGWLAAGLAICAGLGLFALARARIGGVTGDVFGATVELVEAVLLLAACLRWSA